MAKKGEGVESTTPFGEVAGKSVKGHGGFGFRKEDKDLYEAFNAELKKFIGSPEHIALVDALRLRQGLSAEQDDGRALQGRIGSTGQADHARAARREAAPMGSAPSPALVIVSFAAGLTVASFAGFRAVPARAAPRRVADGRDHARWAAVLAVAMALVAGLARLYGPAPVRWLAVVYVEFFRGTSALVQLFWLFFVLPQFGISLRAVHRRRARPRPQCRRLWRGGGARRDPGACRAASGKQRPRST